MTHTEQEAREFACDRCKDTGWLEPIGPCSDGFTSQADPVIVLHTGGGLRTTMSISANGLSKLKIAGQASHEGTNQTAAILDINGKEGDNRSQSSASGWQQDSCG